MLTAPPARARHPARAGGGAGYVEVMLDVSPYREPLAAFANRWMVRELALFGSAVRDDFGPESDVDLLVTFEEGETWSLLDIVEMKLELEDLFGRSVDLMTKRAVEKSANWIRRETILESARTVYASG